MQRNRITGSLMLLAVAVWLAARCDADEVVDFNRHIRPILARHCFRCHGQDEVHREAGLRLDLRAAATGELESGSVAIVPGDAEASELAVRIEAEDDGLRMPPAELGVRLSEAEIETISAWIEQGAPYARHWSFIPPRPQAPPPVSNPAWASNGIDRFVLAELDRQNLTPAAEASRFELIRRLSLDLRGLPPTPAEVAEFSRATRPDAYLQLVARFLDDPAYGERWARLWLDLARYADSRGYGSDPLRPNMWRYRDWVIEAFNRNLPYDQFTIDQLAGDLLPNSTLAQQMATAFHRNTMTNTEGGTDDEEFRVAAVKDRIETTMQVWMGLTMQCANCHDHKYDPIKQDEYYRLFAIFNQTADTDLPSDEPVIKVPTAQMLAQHQAIDEQIQQLKAQLAAAQQEPLQQQIAAIEKQIAALEKSKPAIPTLPVMQELPPDKRRETYLMVKGNFLDRGKQVQPALPASLQPAGPNLASLQSASLQSASEAVTPSRLDAAKWLMAEDNPLTSRVAVNRVWAQLFGIGLVETEEDFGTQGEPPSHPELLDWLANEFVAGGWDLKQLIKLIVTSSTYRQSARVTPALTERDPRNRLLARGPRFRLDAETLRDQALALSGLLSRKLYGPSVYPYQPKGLWRAAFNGQRTWPVSQGEDKFRRGVYTFWRRTVPYPSMQTFDAPSREICTVRRIRTNTPLQAFVTLNDPVYVEAAQGLARRIMQQGGRTPRERASFALQLCLARPAVTEQVDQLVALYESEATFYGQEPEMAQQISSDPLGPAPDGVDLAELAAWTIVANVLLNLDGVLTK